jgi:hypothetical protein
MTPSKAERHKLERKQQKHHEFQHDGHVDFKFIENVNAKDKNLGNKIKYIKNPTSSAGDSDHIEAEMQHLRHLHQ